MRRRRMVLVTLCTVAMCLSTVGCAEWALAIGTTIQALKQYKQMHEVFASEIKRTYSPTDASYVEAERSYLAARSRYLAYVEAVKLAVESNEKADLTKVTEEVEQASAEFLRSSSRGLQSGTEPRELPVDAASKLSRSVHTHLSKVPEQHRDMVLQALDETQWRSWREI